MILLYGGQKSYRNINILHEAKRVLYFLINITQNESAVLQFVQSIYLRERNDTVI